jgi:hypothetical protein
LLGEGGADQGKHAPVDLQGEGSVGTGLGAATVFDAQGERFAINSAGAIEGCQGELDADFLVLAVNVGIAGEGQNGPNGNALTEIDRTLIV